MARHETVREHIVYHYSCDFCGDEGDKTIVNQCYICRRDTCVKCAKFHDIHDETYTYKQKERWCKHCFKLAAKIGVLGKFEKTRYEYLEEMDRSLTNYREYIRKRLL